MSSSNNQQHEIKQLLHAEIEAIHLLSQSLELEYDALSKQHADALEDIVRNKQERILHLETITRQREKLLAVTDNVTVSEESGENKRYQFNGNQELVNLWNEVVIAAEKCREKNRVNGSIVELVSKQSRHALDILHGILPETTQVSETYDNAGKTRAYANKRSLVHV